MTDGKKRPATRKRPLEEASPEAVAVAASLAALCGAFGLSHAGMARLLSVSNETYRNIRKKHIIPERMTLLTGYRRLKEKHREVMKAHGAAFDAYMKGEPSLHDGAKLARPVTQDRCRTFCPLA